LIIIFLIAEPHGLAQLWPRRQGKTEIVALPALAGGGHGQRGGEPKAEETTGTPGKIGYIQREETPMQTEDGLRWR